jgi:hypothetical protein
MKKHHPNEMSIAEKVTFSLSHLKISKRTTSNIFCSWLYSSLYNEKEMQHSDKLPSRSRNMKLQWSMAYSPLSTVRVPTGVERHDLFLKTSEQTAAKGGNN